MKIEMLQASLNELEETVFHYEAIRPDLGVDLQNEFGRCAQYIQHHPEVPSLRRGGYRRVNLKKFPYYITYQIRGDTAWILTFAHTARRPEYWLGRVKRFFR